MLIDSLSIVKAQHPTHQNSTIEQPVQTPDNPRTANVESEAQVDSNEFSQDRRRRLPDIVVLGVMKCGTGKYRQSQMSYQME